MSLPPASRTKQRLTSHFTTTVIGMHLAPDDHLKGWGKVLQNNDPFAASPPLTHEQLRAAVTARRVRYLTLGYECVPVLSGDKAVHLPNWQEAKLDLNTASTWADDRPGELSTGIRTRLTPAFDIDIRDANVADRVQQALLNQLSQQGPLLVRIGLPPKRLIPCRCEEPFKKISVHFKSPDGVVHGVDVLCDGQQFVAEGIHKDTRQPYRWNDNVDLLTTAHEHLPLIDKALAERFVTKASTIMECAGWVQVDAQGRPKKDGKPKAKPNGNGKAKPKVDDPYSTSRLRTNALHLRPCRRIADATTRSTPPPSTCSS
jgi:Bifunctional DNA primase/polymerase, N-terminal